VEPFRRRRPPRHTTRGSVGAVAPSSRRTNDAPSRIVGGALGRAQPARPRRPAFQDRKVDRSDQVDGSGRAAPLYPCPRMRVHIDVGHRPEVPFGDTERAAQNDNRLCWQARAERILSALAAESELRAALCFTESPVWRRLAPHVSVRNSGRTSRAPLYVSVARPCARREAANVERPNT